MYRLSYRVSLSILCVAWMLMGAGAADATVVTYKLSGDITGTVGTNSFSASSFLLTATGDASAVFSGGPGVFVTPLSSVDVNILGIGTIQPLDAFFVYVNEGIF